MAKIATQFKFEIGQMLFVTSNPHCGYAALSNGVAAIIKARVLDVDNGELCYVYETTTHEKHVGGWDNMLATDPIEHIEQKYSPMEEFPTLLKKGI
jgi:hypothetical protein